MRLENRKVRTWKKECDRLGLDGECVTGLSNMHNKALGAREVGGVYSTEFAG